MIVNTWPIDYHMKERICSLKRGPFIMLVLGPIRSGAYLLVDGDTALKKGHFSSIIK